MPTQRFFPNLIMQEGDTVFWMTFKGYATRELMISMKFDAKGFSTSEMFLGPDNFVQNYNQAQNFPSHFHDAHVRPHSKFWAATPKYQGPATRCFISFPLNIFFPKEIKGENFTLPPNMTPKSVCQLAGVIQPTMVKAFEGFKVGVFSFSSENLCERASCELRLEMMVSQSAKKNRFKPFFDCVLGYCVQNLRIKKSEKALSSFDMKANNFPSPPANIFLDRIGCAEVERGRGGPSRLYQLSQVPCICIHSFNFFSKRDPVFDMELAASPNGVGIDIIISGTQHKPKGKPHRESAPVLSYSLG